jgi:beta-lactamase regulating signal transducer with metallopeptidase domain
MNMQQQQGQLSSSKPQDNELMSLASASRPLASSSSFLSSGASVSSFREVGSTAGSVKSKSNPIKNAPKKEESINLSEFVLLLCCIGIQVSWFLFLYVLLLFMFSSLIGISEYDLFEKS